MLQGLNISLALTSYHANRIMLVRDGQPAIVTTFCSDDKPSVWRAFKGDGTVMSVSDNRVIVEDLLMPHSPRLDRRLAVFLRIRSRSLPRGWLGAYPGR